MAKPRPRPKAKKVGRDDLGAGLKALFNKEVAENEQPSEELVKELSNTVATIPVNHIEPNPHQPRVEFEEEALQELAESIQTHGLIQPITVRYLGPNSFQLISGERRWRASQRAKLEKIPAYVRVANDQEMMEMALIENIQRQDLNPIEIADTYLRLKEEFQLTDEKLSERVGKKRTTVTNYMRLRKLPVEMQEAVRDRQISMGHARALAGVDDFAMQNAFFRKTINEGLSVRALEKAISEFNTPKPAKSANDDLPDDYKDIQQDFRNFFGTKKVQLKLKDKKGKGQIVIPFTSVKELNDLLDRIEE